MDKLRSGQSRPKANKIKRAGVVKLCWKAPQGSEKYISRVPGRYGKMPILLTPSEDFRFRAAQAAFGQKLRGSETLAVLRPAAKLLNGVKCGRGEDRQGYRAEFI